MITPARYEVVTHNWWVTTLGRLHDPDGPSGEHTLQGLHVDCHWPVGCYVAVDVDDSVRYVGQVRRTVGGFSERFGSHHQPVDTWDRVWLLPLRRDVPPGVVSLIEALLVLRLRPSDNGYRPAIGLRLVVWA